MGPSGALSSRNPVPAAADASSQLPPLLLSMSLEETEAERAKKRERKEKEASFSGSSILSQERERRVSFFREEPEA